VLFPGRYSVRTRTPSHGEVLRCSKEIGSHWNCTSRLSFPIRRQCLILSTSFGSFLLVVFYRKIYGERTINSQEMTQLYVCLKNEDLQCGRCETCHWAGGFRSGSSVDFCAYNCPILIGLQEWLILCVTKKYCMTYVRRTQRCGECAWKSYVEICQVELRVHHAVEKLHAPEDISALWAVRACRTAETRPRCDVLRD
jgi:hypothetical protein